MLSEISQTEKDKYCMNSYVECVKENKMTNTKPVEKKTLDLWLPEGRLGKGELEDGGPKT